MARCCNEITPSAVDASQGDLDRRQIGFVGEGSRRLELRDRCRVLAESGVKLADPRVGPWSAGGSECDRRLQEVDRLAVGEDRFSPIGRLDECGSSFRCPTGSSLMPGDQRVACEVIEPRRRRIEADRVGRPAMQQPSAGQARRLVDDVADPAMGEVVADGRRRVFWHLPDEAASDHLIHRLDRLLLGSTARRPDRRQVERSSDDGGGRQDLHRGLADRCDPVTQQRIDASGDRTAGSALAGKRRHHVQRHALRVRGQRVDERVVRDSVRSHRPDHIGDVLPFETSEGDAC